MSKLRERLEENAKIKRQEKIIIRTCLELSREFKDLAEEIKDDNVEEAELMIKDIADLVKHIKGEISNLAGMHSTGFSR